MSMTLNFFEHSFNRGRRLQEAGRNNEVARNRAELGKVQIALGMGQDGLQSLEQAVELEPENPEMLRDLVDALMDLGREADAFSRAKAALFSAPRIQGFRTLWNDLCFC